MSCKMANFAAVLQSSGKFCNRFANCCSAAPDMDGGGLTDRGPPLQGACREGRGSEPGSHGLKSIKRGRRDRMSVPLFPLASPERRPGPTAKSNSGTERRQSSERKLLKSFRLYANEKDSFFFLLFLFSSKYRQKHRPHCPLCHVSFQYHRLNGGRS